jgi:hypothetical protein
VGETRIKRRQQEGGLINMRSSFFTYHVENASLRATGDQWVRRPTSIRRRAGEQAKTSRISWMPFHSRFYLRRVCQASIQISINELHMRQQHQSVKPTEASSGRQSRLLDENDICRLPKIVAWGIIIVTQPRSHNRVLISQGTLKQQQRENSISTLKKSCGLFVT